MPELRCRLASFIPLALPFFMALAGCAMLPKPGDAQIVSLSDTIRIEAGTFFAGLAAKSAPDCAYQANSGEYDHLAALAGQLTSHLTANHAGLALIKASDALQRTIEGVRASHQAASAKRDDANGVCMASGAIMLNADAVARAAAAIGSTQTSAGGQ